MEWENVPPRTAGYRYDIPFIPDAPYVTAKQQNSGLQNSRARQIGTQNA
jgi:hypothetical protein